MALRRRQQIGKADGAFSFTYDSPPPPSAGSSSSSSSASSLAAKAIRASSAYRDSSLSSVYEQSALSSPRGSSPSAVRDPSIYDHAPKKSVNGSKQGFWGVLAQKAKSIIDEDSAKKHETPRETTFGASDRSKRGQYHSTYDSQDSRRKTEGPGIQKGLDAIASSLNYIGGTIGKSLEEGITAVENRTAGLIQETRKIQIRKKNNSYGSQNQASDFDSLRRQPMQQSHVQTKNHSTDETQLKASRDVEMATTAKAKLLMREMNTVKADFAFAKDRCAQLEEENRMLRESREKGDNPDDDDLIRLQLESLLAEKARLAQENPVYARENRFLREIVEYHQLTMQDVVYFDEGSEEVTEVYPIKLTTASNIQPSAASPTPTPTPTVPYGAIKAPPNVSLETAPSVEFQEAPQTTGATNPYVQMPGEDIRKK